MPEQTQGHDDIEILAELKTVDAVRELIQIYKNCEWRETKFKIIESVSGFSHQRSFQFLFQIALDQTDLPISEKAIHCLSSMNSPICVRFLNHQYKMGPSYLKPAMIKALACIPDRTLAPEFLSDLSKALVSQHVLLAKNLILALGEFKFQPATEILFQIAANKKQRDLALSAIVSLGQILRSTDQFKKLEPEFKKDSFEYQIFTTSLHQIQFRSQWKIEDYLNKFYTNEKYHPALFFEICSFSDDDINAGLELFANPENIQKTLKLVSHLPNHIAVPFYEKLDNTEATLWNSISAHHHSAYKKIILASKNIKDADWLNCLTSTLPNADDIYKDIFTSPEYNESAESEKMLIIQYFFDYIYVYSGDTKKINTCGAWIETVLSNEKNESIKGRWIRLLSDIRFENHNLIQKIIQYLPNKNLSPSCLYYIKNNQHHSFTETLLKNSDIILNNFMLISQWIKALSKQNKDKSDDKNIAATLTPMCKISDEKLKIDILKFLNNNPIPELKIFVTENLSAQSTELNLFSIITIKKYADENNSELIAKHLNSNNPTLRGRALDTLISQPGLRAKRLAIDYFKENAANIEICEKITRCFVGPENSTDYFSNIVVDIIKKYPDHPLIENLNDFQNQLQQQIQSETKTGFSSNEPDIQKIEKDLEKKLIHYKFYDETAKSALRSAEVPFHHPEMYDRYIDKSAIILGYSKAIDIILEKQLGRKILFPNLEKRIFEFQNAVHIFALNEDFPVAEQVLKNLGLEKEFSAQSLPVHKMSLVAKGILNTKIINDHFKILDGLRAWSVILLLFSRKTQLQPKPLVPLFTDDSTTIQVAKKLMWLQDLRNPVAHRQTIIDFKALEDIRSEVFKILVLLNQLFEKK